MSNVPGKTTKMRPKNWPFDTGSWQAYQELSHWHRVVKTLDWSRSKERMGMEVGSPVSKELLLKFKKKRLALEGGVRVGVSVVFSGWEIQQHICIY